MNHKVWLENEYTLWIEALQSSTVNNFKEHPQVKRMLGEVDGDLFIYDENKKIDVNIIHSLLTIDRLGYTHWNPKPSGNLMRFNYYARKIIKINPKNIAEIGGGVGQFYAVLRALGYKGEYYIWDLTEVKKFQYKYLKKVAEVKPEEPLTLEGNLQITW